MNKQNPVYVISCDGEPLMPTFRYSKVRKLLKNNKAKIIKRDPFFTIQLLEITTDFTQKITAGMDIGETIGLSVVSENNRELLSAELQTRSKKITSKLEDKASYRKTRRNKLRHRKKRFDNRGASKGTCKHCGGNAKSGKQFCSKCLREVGNIHQLYRNDVKTFNQKRLAPSVKHSVETHFKIKDQINSILPIENKDWIIEKTKFDIQKMENIDISGVAYQQGDLFGFSSLRDYILERDNHICQNNNCKHRKNKKENELKKNNPYINKSIILQIHHIVYRSKGGTDRPSNLITLCTDCHTPQNHQKGGFLYEWFLERKRVQSNYRSATKMNVVASAFNDYKNTRFTVGSKTKRKRQLLNLDKTHANDAYSICFNDDNFEIDKTNENKPTVKLKENIKINKIENPLLLVQTNGRENGRRSLQSFFDAKYIDSRDNTIKTGSQLPKTMKKRTPVKDENYRIFRKEKKSKGKLVIRKSISKFKNNSIVKFNIDDKQQIVECAGMTNTNILTKNFDKKFVATKKYNVENVCTRKGIIKKDIKNL